MDCETFRREVPFTFELGNVVALDNAVDAQYKHMQGCPACAAWFEENHNTQAKETVSRLFVVALLVDTSRRTTPSIIALNPPANDDEE